MWAETLLGGVTAQGILRYALWRRTWLSRLDEDNVHVSSKRMWGWTYVLTLHTCVCQSPCHIIYASRTRQIFRVRRLWA